MRVRTPPALSRAGYDHAVARRTDEDWQQRVWPSAAVLTVDAEGNAPTARRSDGGVELVYSPSADVDERSLRVFLGLADGLPYFAALDLRDSPSAADDRWTVRPGATRAGLRAVGAELDDLGSGLLAAAVALRNWHVRNPRCAHCGAPTEVVHAGWARRCVSEQILHFPRTDPAVIMLVHDGADRCVLGRQSRWPAGRYSILAGFVDAGESVEATVAREVAEEVGIAVTEVEYVASQPWPFPASIMLGFTARADGAQQLRVDHDEIADARWVSREEIRRMDGIGELPGPVSIAHRLITDWVDADHPAC